MSRKIDWDRVWLKAYKAAGVSYLAPGVGSKMQIAVQKEVEKQLGGK